MAGRNPIPTLPYYAPGYTKSDFPMIEQIVEGGENLTSGDDVTVDITWGYIVKWGDNVHIEEGLTMMFVAQHTTIPVPKVLAMWEDLGTNIIIMEKINGCTLMDSWHNMGHRQKAAVMAQIRGHLTQMRNLAWPGYFGGVLRQRCLDVFVASRNGDQPDIDPGRMKTEAHWVAALLNARRILRRGKEVPADIAKPFRDEAARRGDGFFTHGDLHPGNVMVEDDGRVVFIDWERAGWAPSYWERGPMLIGPAGADSCSSGRRARRIPRGATGPTTLPRSCGISAAAAPSPPPSRPWITSTPGSTIGCRWGSSGPHTRAG